MTMYIYMATVCPLAVLRLVFNSSEEGTLRRARKRRDNVVRCVHLFEMRNFCRGRLPTSRSFFCVVHFFATVSKNCNIGAGGGERGHLFIACLGLLTVDHAFLETRARSGVGGLEPLLTLVNHAETWMKTANEVSVPYISTFFGYLYYLAINFCSQLRAQNAAVWGRITRR